MYVFHKWAYFQDKISISHKCLYNYRRHTLSITYNRNDKQILDWIYALGERIEFLKHKKEEEIYLSTLRLYISHILAGYYDLYVMDRKKFKKELNETKKRLKDIPLEKIKKINFEKKTYLKILLFRLSTLLYCKIKYIEKSLSKKKYAYNQTSREI